MVKYFTEHKQSTTKRIKSEKILAQLAQADEYYSKRQYNEAIDIYKSLEDKIDDSYRYDKCELYRKMGNNYYAMPDYDNAIIAYEKTLKYYNNNASIYNMLGFMYFYKDSSKSIEYYLKKMKLAPELKTFVMLTQVMIKSKDYGQKDLKEIFEHYVDKFRPEILAGKEPYHYDYKSFDPNKKLKIGYLSSDFYTHAMMQFVIPILEHHDKEKFDFVLYSCSDRCDIATNRIKETGMKFEECHALTNEELVQKIHDDGVDILVDLGGYTHSRIWTLLYKPAPIQIQYLGFLGTYGMREVDYILADKFTIPEDIAQYYTEKPLYINCGMNRFNFSTRNQKFLDIPPLPYLKNGYITFGSFNCLSKINPYTVSVWSKILKAVPNSKLLIYRTQLQDRDIVRYKKQFKENDIDENRIIFDNKPAKPNHFAAYPKCDIALDPLPFSGLTITIELLHSGIPVLCMPGETIASKGAARVCKMMKLNEFVADSEQELVELAVNLTSDIEKLKWYRENLRTIVFNSEMFNNYDKYVQQIENAYQNAWENFCKGL
ncbi:hypothetical protein J6E39_03540 [bacterium]|nr:hypothetical protein [bacterium]